jgi:hypothetical protein
VDPLPLPLRGAANRGLWSDDDEGVSFAEGAAGLLMSWEEDDDADESGLRSAVSLPFRFIAATYGFGGRSKRGDEEGDALLFW